ncbi:bcl-2/adenovirus E1B 19 kDa-interacting protein 2-like protein [Tyto alba]|uniref:bcl-2/adenovirus E1B 19 kDa-interacting protein 2-like protein n=1 Tax=Tyto alba TaxID=56313 RepID=UPI001C678CD7|nr:bcl-2/adenovirus E1B 19 kDa-interacting protein 2-like protein [Tyto alba]
MEDGVDLSTVEPYSQVLSHGGNVRLGSKGGTLLGPLTEPGGSGRDGWHWLCHPPLWPGYHGRGFGAILLFAACCLPHGSIPQYSYMMENLLRYIMGTLERTVADCYVLVCLSGAAARGQIPSFGWMERCYRAGMAAGM